jgi:hypothetical protein
VPFERNGQKFELIDTAGLRRKGKVFEAIEKFSVVKTLQAIESANVVLLLLDATQGVTDQDAHIAGYILEAAAPWCWRSTNGTRWMTTSASCCSAPSRRACVPEICCDALHLGQEAPGPGPAVDVDRQATRRPPARCPRRC